MTDQKHTKELLPCPFCGGEPEIERMGTSRSSMIISCTDCGCRVESGDVTLSDPKWNMRDDSDLLHRNIQLDALTKQRDELREALKALVNLLDKKKPRKLDEAITWVENENMVMKMVNLALTKTKGAV